MDISLNGNAGDYPEGTTTGRYLVLLDEDAAEPGIAALTAATGAVRVTASDDVSEPAANEALYFPELGVAVLDANPQAMGEFEIASTPGVLTVEPERMNEVLRTTDEIPAVHTTEYLLGYREAVMNLTAPAADLDDQAATLAAADERVSAWGLQAVNAIGSRYTGKGTRVAVLDTGLDLKHPDYVRRTIVTQSFVPGEGVQDANGHGTHCIGTSMGPKTVASGPRYGLAYEAEIYAGKVLSNAGSGSDAQILGGIEWAIRNKCAVVSMSLGARTRPGQSFSAVFEAAAARAQRLGTLIVAAAGNDSRRPGSTTPVSHPANCPSIMAVAAVDSSLRVAGFSNRGINPSGGQVDIAGPGVNVYSSVPMPGRYARFNGTSMATPHVAGVAALLAQAYPAARGLALWHLLTSRARRLPAPSADVGAGLVQAP
ncbi:MAG TPA: S8 family serine peptidase [Solirubrobacteraceae bacterium]|nr:S8 family serine peptidase [Solirubrobacteraceae bacterium]